MAKQGRPLKFATPEELEAKINEYFSTCGRQRIKNSDGTDAVEWIDGEIVPVYKEQHPTVSGMALYLGFSCRQSLYQYSDHDGFYDTIKAAISRIEQYAEERLMDGGRPTGAIFWLKNHGWRDEKFLDATVKESKRDLSKLTDEELRTMAEIEKKITS